MLSNLTLFICSDDTGVYFLFEGSFIIAVLTDLIPGGEGDEKQMLKFPTLCLLESIPALISSLFMCFGVMLILISLITFSFLDFKLPEVSTSLVF